MSKNMIFFKGSKHCLDLSSCPHIFWRPSATLIPHTLHTVVKMLPILRLNLRLQCSVQSLIRSVSISFKIRANFFIQILFKNILNAGNIHIVLIDWTSLKTWNGNKVGWTISNFQDLNQKFLWHIKNPKILMAYIKNLLRIVIGMKRKNLSNIICTTKKSIDF